MTRPPATATANPLSAGLSCSTEPSATPASDTWDKVSAISTCLRSIRYTPSSGPMMPIRPPAQNARCMNS
ncbi:hypothetical protein D3C87_2141780 [compost metagenome]